VKKWSASGGMSSRRSASEGTVDRDHVEPVEQVLAEALVGDLLLESRAVEETTRTSTPSWRLPPTRTNFCSVSTRRIRAWVLSGMSAISSR
jgi:hypothetical protein